MKLSVLSERGNLDTFSITICDPESTSVEEDGIWTLPCLECVLVAARELAFEALRDCRSSAIRIWIGSDNHSSMIVIRDGTRQEIVMLVLNVLSFESSSH